MPNPIASRNEETAVDIVNIIVGIGLALTPWLAGFSSETHAATNAWVVGVVIALVAIGALVSFREWEEWVNLLLGLWAIISPWVVGFSSNSAATYSHLIAGIIVAVLAATKLWLVRAHPSTV